MLALSIACTVAAAAWTYLVAGHGGYWRTSERLPRVTREPDAWPDVVAVVPARNEAETGFGLRLERRGRRELVFERLAEEVRHRSLEVRRDGRHRLEAGEQRDKTLAELEVVCGVE